MTKGGRVQETIDIVRANGGAVAGVAMVVDRSNDAVNLGVPTVSLIALQVETFDPNNLPNDAAALREMLLDTQQMLLGAMAQLDVTREQLAAKEHELQRVRHWLEQLLRHRYGQKRERVDENQLFLFAVELASMGQDAPPESKPASSVSRPAPRGHGRQRLPKSSARSGSAKT